MWKGGRREPRGELGEASTRQEVVVQGEESMAGGGGGVSGAPVPCGLAVHL